MQYMVCHCCYIYYMMCIKMHINKLKSYCMKSQKSDILVLRGDKHDC
jgi:hypothetical protein